MRTSRYSITRALSNCIALLLDHQYVLQYTNLFQCVAVLEKLRQYKSPILSQEQRTTRNIENCIRAVTTSFALGLESGAGILKAVLEVNQVCKLKPENECENVRTCCIVFVNHISAPA